MTIKLNKEELYKLYWEKEYSFIEIGKIFNCANSTLGNRFKKYGIKKRTIKEAGNTKRFQKKCSARNSAENNPNWKGGEYKTFYGYVQIKKPEHPRADTQGYVHRSHLIAEKTLGRYLYPEEITHHKNERRDDDSPENIDVMTRGEHTSLHHKK